jgi:hypothetical protein
MVLHAADMPAAAVMMHSSAATVAAPATEFPAGTVARQTAEAAAAGPELAVAARFRRAGLLQKVELVD